MLFVVGFKKTCCITMKLPVKAIDVNDIFVDVSLTAATIISTFAIGIAI